MTAIRKPRPESAKATFDAVEWTRQRRDEMYEATRDMSAADLIAYVRRAAAAAERPPASTERGPA
jgi:hypothetical protein